MNKKKTPTKTDGFCASRNAQCSNVEEYATPSDMTLFTHLTHFLWPIYLQITKSHTDVHVYIAYRM
jgi:hypothetical protein